MVSFNFKAYKHICCAAHHSSTTIKYLPSSHYLPFDPISAAVGTKYAVISQCEAGFIRNHQQKYLQVCDFCLWLLPSEPLYQVYHSTSAFY